jgi:FixJ family two-component response regulator
VEEEDPYLQKPFTSQDLLRAVKNALAEVAGGPPEAEPAAAKPAL